MSNPSIEELSNPEEFELIAELSHANIKEFVLDQLARGGRLVYAYMVYQVVIMAAGIFFITQALLQAIRSSPEALYYVITALVFSFTLLIPIHELLHGLALKITGASKISYGAYFKRFIFYAEADRHVLNKKQFFLVALTPLLVVKAATLIGIILFWPSSPAYFFVLVMAAHSFFCAGDIALMTVFKRHSNVYTYDERAAKRSFYFRKK